MAGNLDDMEEGRVLLLGCRFDLGTADELGLDVLINTLTCFSKE